MKQHFSEIQIVTRLQVCLVNENNQNMWKEQFKKYVSGIGSLAIATITVTTSLTPAIAAETIKFDYGIASQSVSLEELEIFAKTGEVSPALDFLFKFTNQNPELIRLLLVQKIPLDTVTTANLLNNPIGEYVLDRLSSVVHSGAARGNREALRGALITSINEDRQISLLEVWRNYPTKEVIVEGRSWNKMTDEFSRTLQQAGTKAEQSLTFLQNFLNPR